jgi:hypothetical protein
MRRRVATIRPKAPDRASSERPASSRSIRSLLPTRTVNGVGGDRTLDLVGGSFEVAFRPDADGVGDAVQDAQEGENEAAVIDGCRLGGEFLGSLLQLRKQALEKERDIHTEEVGQLLELCAGDGQIAILLTLQSFGGNAEHARQLVPGDGESFAAAPHGLPYVLVDEGHGL